MLAYTSSILQRITAEPRFSDKQPGCANSGFGASAQKRDVRWPGASHDRVSPRFEVKRCSGRRSDDGHWGGEPHRGRVAPDRASSRNNRTLEGQLGLAEQIIDKRGREGDPHGAEATDRGGNSTVMRAINSVLKLDSSNELRPLWPQSERPGGKNANDLCQGREVQIRTANRYGASGARNSRKARSGCRRGTRSRGIRAAEGNRIGANRQSAIRQKK